MREDANARYTYDEAGNLKTRALKATGKFTAYGYDAESQLVQIQEFNSNLDISPTKTLTFRYDGLGRRIEKKLVPQVGATKTREGKGDGFT